jgi:hypothetical protein
MKVEDIIAFYLLNVSLINVVIFPLSAFGKKYIIALTKR